MKNAALFFFTVVLLLLPELGLAQKDLPKEKMKVVEKQAAPINGAPEKNVVRRAPVAVLPSFEQVPNDPLGVKVYTLRNGMKLYLSRNEAEPRIFTNIAVRAGSKHDPAEATGLAHYLEHMMFKGTDRIGAMNWEKEKVLLAKISDLYEQHRNEADPQRRKAIYAEIDRVSGEAAKLVAASEYDKLVSSLGARGTNAYTWVEQTVYVNDIPSNELERWMQLESDRFKMVALRLFHTELETVYEEFNISQDRDFRKVSATINESLYPTHPYGLWTTIGKGEHLKNPSHVKIQEYFSTYYNPNNMALVLAGDFAPEKAVALAEKYFGSYQPKKIPAFIYPEQPPVQGIVRKEVLGQEAAYLQLAWRFGGATSPDADYLTLISRLLYNGRAGLIDLELLQQQRVLEARASLTAMADFSTFQLYGKPREGQSLEEVEQLLLMEIENLKQGKFEDWLVQAVIKDLKLKEIRANENNSARTGQMTGAFILGMDWSDYVHRFDRLEKLTKQDIVRFANEHFRDNYVVVYKRTGDDPNVMKVEKPAITPVEVNREAVSDFSEDFLALEAPRLEPVFVDYANEIKTQPLANGVELDYIHNRNNELFTLAYIVEMGKNSDRELALAISYLPYLGTDKYSPDELKQAFFRLGLNFSVNVSTERLYVTLSGLDESMAEGMALLEHILSNVQGSDAALKNLVQDVLLKRENDKKDKQTVLRSAMYNYARYGAESPFTNRLTANELHRMRPLVLVEKIKSLTSFEHRVFYYGPSQVDKVTALLKQHHRVPAQLQPLLPAKEFTEKQTASDQVIFVDFPMVQAEIMLVSMGTDTFNLEEFVMSELYNAYFGSGLSSIVFQEIRESRALAYSAYAFADSPSKKEQAHFLRAYVGTQPDKLQDAIGAMTEILEEMPVSEEQIEQAVLSIQKKIETGRITKDSIYWSFRAVQRRGFSHDVRSNVYEKMKSVTPSELRSFQQRHIQGRNYTYLVLGSQQGIDFEYLRSLGPVTELTVDEVFGERNE